MQNIFWITLEAPGRLAIVTRPRPDDWLSDEIVAFKQEQIDVLVSALVSEEADDLGLADESKCCESHQIEFIAFPVVDRSTPSPAALIELAKTLESHLARGKTVGIHCRASIGRASLIAAAVLGRFGVSADEAFSRISAARGCNVPDTPQQRVWFEENVKPCG